MEARFHFRLKTTVAVCDVVFEFADFSRKRDDSEFQIGVKNIRITEGQGDLKASQIEKQVFESLEERKTDFLKLRLSGNEAEPVMYNDPTDIDSSSLENGTGIADQADKNVQGSKLATKN